MEGFRSAVYSVVDQIAKSTTAKGGVNIISSLLSAEDLRYFKEIFDEMKISYTLLPDYSESLDGESWQEYQKIPKGGTTLERISAMGSASGTIEMGAVSEQKSVARLLESRFGVKGTTMPVPIGIDLSDSFFSALENYSGHSIPERIRKERGRLVDSYIDAHKYLFDARAVLFGEADLVSSLASFMSEIGVKVVMCATGARKTDLPATLGEELAAKGAILSDDTDFATMLERAKSLSPDFVIGSSKGFYLSKNLGVPIVRCGFPVHDRFGGQRIMHVGYRGTQQLLDRIVNTILERRQDESSVGYSYM
jgi:nitrogenase molybdenum-iron protein NifN